MSTAKRKRLPFWRSVGGAYVLTFRNLGFFARISWAWLLLTVPLMIGAKALDFHLTGSLFGRGGGLAYLIGSLLLSLVSLPMLASIAVAWHRKILVGETVPGRIYLRFDRAVINYLALALLVKLVLKGPLQVGIATMLIPDLLGTGSDAKGVQRDIVLITSLLTAIFMICYFISTKVWLALPARALGHSHVTIGRAWEASRGNVWRLVCGTLLFGLPVFLLILYLMLNWSDIVFPFPSTMYHSAAFETGVSLMMTIFVGLPVLTFLSLAYRELLGDKVAI